MRTLILLLSLAFLSSCNEYECYCVDSEGNEQIVSSMRMSKRKAAKTCDQMCENDKLVKK